MFATISGWSMNQAIVHVLELYFPEPSSLEERMTRLADMAHGLRELPSTPAVDKLIDELRETFEAVVSGKQFVDDDSTDEERSRLRDHLDMWNLYEPATRTYRRKDKEAD